MAIAALTAHQVVAGAWARGLQPPPDLLVSEWAAKFRIVTPPTPAPGEWRNERTPYLVGIMDCASPSHPAREIDVMAATQLGKTEAAVNIVGFYSHQAPTSGLIVLPSKDIAREWSTLRLQPLFESTPALQQIFQQARNRRRAKSNTTYQIRLSNGASWKIAWSSSAKVLRSTPAAFILADEVDGFDRQAGGGKKGEGDPVTLLRKRFANFRRGKFFRVSSPTDRTGSRIERGFREGDQRYYFVPCPECNHFQRLDFHRLTWESGTTATRAQRAARAQYRCAGCEKLIPEYKKTEMLARGMWVATRSRPELVNAGFAYTDLPSLAPIFAEMAEEPHPSFHLSGMYSPLGWLAWSTIAADWERAQGDPEALKVFVMTTLAETWVDRGEAPDWEKIYVKCRYAYTPGIIPRGALFLTAGGDVQPDRIEVEVVGWGRGKRSWSIFYGVLSGDTETETPWLMLDELLARDWPLEGGGTIPIMAMGIDSGFRAHKIYAFAIRHSQPEHSMAGSEIVLPRTVVPTKGGADWGRLIAHVSSEDAARKRGGLKIVEIGTAWAKQELYDNLRYPRAADGEIEPSGTCHFPDEYQMEFFRGLCSESRVTSVSGKSHWVKDPAIRNEPLDCRVIARAMAGLAGIDQATPEQWDALERRLGPRPTPVIAENTERPESYVQQDEPAMLRKPRALRPGTYDNPYL